MDRLERFYKIDQLLKDRKVVSFADFKKELGMSPASVKRDIQYMRTRFNAPIDYDREVLGYRFGIPGAGPRYELPGLWFNGAEVHSLLTALQLLTGLQPGLLDRQVSPLTERLRAILGSGDHSWQEIEKRIRIFQPGRRASTAAHFGIVSAALLKRLRLRIKHYNRNLDKETEREVSPQRLVHYRDNWYLDAYCHMREEMRSFAVDAVREARLLDARSKDVPKADLDKHLGSGYGIFAGAKVEWAKLKFSAQAARWVSAQEWHPEQRVKIEQDGCYLLEIPYSDDRELLMEVLKFGSDVEVVGPPALRRRTSEALIQAVGKYRESP